MWPLAGERLARTRLTLRWAIHIRVSVCRSPISIKSEELFLDVLGNLLGKAVVRTL